MAKSKRERFRGEVDRIRESDRISDAERDRIIEFVRAKDPESVAVAHPDTKADGTLARYAHGLYRVAELTDFDLTDCTAGDLNLFFGRMIQGRVEGVKDEGLTKGSVGGYQGPMRKFYQYHDDLGIEKGDIGMFEKDSKAVDPRDIFDREDIARIRRAANHPRDRALVDLLLYTGQRLDAVLSLKNKDIDIEEGVFYLPDEGDLKGAEGKRPLLYAEASARNWMNSHPCPDPEAHFITHKYDWENKPYEAGEKLHQSTVNKQLKRIGEAAGIEKPMNAHNFRHTFVTICKRDYGMDNDTIKRLIGHELDSKIMEETYAHLTDDDIVDAAREATGLKEEEEGSPLTPDFCDNCGEPINRPDAKSCPGCGIDFRPDSYTAKKTLDDALFEDKGDAEGQSEAGLNVIRTLLKEHPDELIQALDEAPDEDLADLVDELDSEESA